MANMQVDVARIICAKSLSGFCTNVGKELGCKVGRGEMFNNTNCKATYEQLAISGYIETARDILYYVGI